MIRRRTQKIKAFRVQGQWWYGIYTRDNAQDLNRRKIHKNCGSLMPTAYIKSLCDTYLALIEGVTLRAYPDSGGVWTIGTGHTGPDVHAGEVITMAQERVLLDNDLASVYAFLDPVVVDPMKYLAWASFGFNCGVGALRLVLTGKAQLAHYIHDRHGAVQPGLVGRRRFELALLGIDVSVLDNPQPIPSTQAIVKSAIMAARTT